MEKLARGVLDSLLEGCQVIGRDFTYLYLNDSAVAHARVPRERLLGRTMMECFPGIDQSPMFAVLRRCMNERTYERMENEFIHADGSRGWFELRFIPVPMGVCVLSLDVTEAKRAAAALAESEEQMRRMQRLEVVGQLAGGVAHDFNNLLSVILCHSSFVHEELPEDHPLRDDLEQIRLAGHRGADLVRQLLAFSRQQVMAPRVLDLNGIVRGLEKMFSRLVDADVSRTFLLAPELGPIKVDPGQLEQVIVNLVVNARDAMPNGGQLTIETKDVVLDEAYAAEHAGVTPGPYVMLAVSDTGTGMDKATLARIFEPFFTTKALGKGTGLGLSTVFGIVKQSGGHIWAYAEPGRGATFKVYFPRAAGEVEPAGPREPATVLKGSGTETILVVEDDAQLRGVIIAILLRHGYHVLEAPNGGEALLICERFGGRIDLLLTDVVLPHMNGRELAERVAPLRPGMRVLFMSGYTDRAIVHHGVLDSGVAYLPKPLTPASLTHKVREVLDAR